MATITAKRLRQRTTANVWRLYANGVWLADFSGPDSHVQPAIMAVRRGEEIHSGFEQKYQTEVWLANGRSPSQV